MLVRPVNHQLSHDVIWDRVCGQQVKIFWYHKQTLQRYNFDSTRFRDMQQYQMRESTQLTKSVICQLLKTEKSFWYRIANFITEMFQTYKWMLNKCERPLYLSLNKKCIKEQRLPVSNHTLVNLKDSYKEDDMHLWHKLESLF